MLRIKYKMALCGVMAALLMAGMEKMARSGDKLVDNLSPDEIFKKAQATYDSLTSYSDKGESTAIDRKLTNLNTSQPFTTFTTKLARPNLYRIEWGMELASNLSQGNIKPNKGIVWSAGEGDFWNIGKGPEKQKSQHWALLAQNGWSGGATVTVPGAFFKTHWSNLLEGFGSKKKREDDEKVGDINCYVFSDEDHPVKTILWIGKQDCLIHQIRFITSDTTVTETHSDIVVNQKFLPKDFTP